MHLFLEPPMHFIERDDAGACGLRILLDGLAGLFVRVRDGRILNQHVEAAELVANALRRRRNRFVISYIQLHSVGIRADTVSRRQTLLEIARSNQNGESVRHEVSRDLQADTLIGAGDECNRFIWHFMISF